MAFSKQTALLDLDTTAIENLFLTDFMPMADGDSLKVYLLGYRFACDPACCDRFSNEVLARHLGIPKEAVLSAWDFWEARGLIRKTASDGSSEYTVEFLSVRQLYIDNNFEPRQTQKPTRTNNPTVDQVSDAVSEHSFQKMFREIESLLGRSLFPNDCMEILEWVNSLNLTPTDILKAFEYSVNEKKAPNINYVSKVVRSWYATAKPGEKSDRTPAVRAKTEKPRTNNRFHNFEGQFSRLSDNELENLIRNHQKRNPTQGGSSE